MVKLDKVVKLLAMPMLWMGIVQLVFSLLSLVLFRDKMAARFFEPACFMLILALVINFLLKDTDLSRIGFRDALLFATLTWALTGVLGAFPVMLVTGVSFTDAVFESVSALTTTGATVLTGLDAMPKSFLMYRQFLQWMGGLGVVIFVVAVLPMLNVGGMRLLKAETPGPVKDDKLSPRIANTAHYLWFIYLLITFLCALSYYFGGMSAYDAIAHSFTTVSTGGFSTHDASMWYFESHLLLAISNLFMLLGAISFGLHFRVLHGKAPYLYWRDEETRVFILIVAALSVALALYLLVGSRYDSLESFSFAAFHVVSFITSTGFGAADLSSWPAASAMFLVFCAYLGGCAGSTAGGNKIIRDIITFKLIRREMQQLIHPRAMLPLRYQNKAVDNEVRSAVMGFMSFAAGSSLVLTLLLMQTGLDFWSSFTAVAACINVLGPGFGQVGSNFLPVSDAGIWLLSVAMLLGRLEYFTVLALFSPLFWRR
ncbi:TrkH family potassium uptake protein [Bowmanella yangjiangensis]|uniref:Trk system potassium uptake protein n=1 Tax=Bowmanella yangjiangensis TaxID=2811230 RepID=A0ABS3CPD9_9ALTE|nr:TrkH family potassium uptake protein [Bowmanella yangjiangensis]MBN7818399.1 potassium transporter [Bowmanella yangjiangensis]